MRRISVLGATGSIGQATVNLVQSLGGAGAFDTVALTGGRNVAELARAARLLGAELAVIAEAALYGDLRDALAGTGIEVAAGPEAVEDAARRPADWVMSAIVGAAGLGPTFAALGPGRVLALANKESLVAAGPLLLDRAKRAGATIIPVDSEHSGVFQALAGQDSAAVERIILTASGGAFRDWPLDRLGRATVAEASRHPNWAMGQRITIDSASMFNKAFEVIEAREYFGLAPAQIEVLIHPESIVHAMVGFRDGAMLAHLGPPDMRHAISYAMHWPIREPLPLARLDLAQAGRLSFAAPDPLRYPALALARNVMDMGGLAGAAFIGAKEAALDAFIAGQIPFTAMSDVVAAVLERFAADQGLGNAAITLDNVRAADSRARHSAAELLARHAA